MKILTAYRGSGDLGVCLVHWVPSGFNYRPPNPSPALSWIPQISSEEQRLLATGLAHKVPQHKQVNDHCRLCEKNRQGLFTATRKSYTNLRAITCRLYPPTPHPPKPVGCNRRRRIPDSCIIWSPRQFGPHGGSALVRLFQKSVGSLVVI